MDQRPSAKSTNHENQHCLLSYGVKMASCTQITQYPSEHPCSIDYFLCHEHTEATFQDSFNCVVLPFQTLSDRFTTVNSLYTSSTRNLHKPNLSADGQSTDFPFLQLEDSLPSSTTQAVCDELSNDRRNKLTAFMLLMPVDLFVSCLSGHLY
jgi:hypothetical protein